MAEASGGPFPSGLERPHVLPAPLPSDLAVPACDSPCSIKPGNGCESSGSGEISVPAVCFPFLSGSGEKTLSYSPQAAGEAPFPQAQ